MRNETSCDVSGAWIMGRLLVFAVRPAGSAGIEPDRRAFALDRDEGRAEAPELQRQLLAVTVVAHQGGLLLVQAAALDFEPDGDQGPDRRRAVLDAADA